MTHGLRRYHHSGQSHFLTFSCYRRQPRFSSPAVYDLFLTCLEDMRTRFQPYLYGYVVMPEHVHLLLSEPQRETLADAMHYLKLSFSKRVSTMRLGEAGSFWYKRYFDRNVSDADEFARDLDYIHHNPVKRGLVNSPSEWKWSSFRHYALREVGAVEIESEWTAIDRETQRTGGPPRTFLRPR